MPDSELIECLIALIENKTFYEILYRQTYFTTPFYHIKVQLNVKTEVCAIDQKTEIKINYISCE